MSFAKDAWSKCCPPGRVRGWWYPQCIRTIADSRHGFIADRDGIVWTVGIGQADVATRRAVSPDTLFRVGSISKTFVGLAALKLVEEGRLSLQIPGAQSGAGGFFSPSTPGA